jgi:hypothetical protein
MGRKLLDDEGVHEGDDCSEPEDDQDLREDAGEGQKATAKEIQEQESLVSVLSTTVDHYFPRMNEWLKELTDIRNQDLIVYERETIFWTGLISLTTKREARMQISHEMRASTFCKNLKELCGQKNLKNVPHGDTVEYLCMRMKPEELEALQVKMMRSLFRGRVLERYRLMGKYHTVAIDAIHIHSFDYAHCENCLVTKDAGGNKRWFHMKLQASLVTPTGLCLPMASEWIENELEYNKQDCELRAFYRLAKKLRRLYPQLPICVLLDGLYAAQPAFEALKEARMEYIVVFKEGSMSYIYPWVMDVKRQCAQENVVHDVEEIEIKDRQSRNHEQRLLRFNPQNKKRMVVKETTYTWMTGIEFSEDRSLFNIMTCEEMVDGEKACDYEWLVSDGLNLNEDTVKPLAKTGRCRWKIENEGINTQKNGGYHLEHLYSRDKVSMKIWCAIIDIAHLINQLIERGSLIVAKAFGSIGNIAKRMFEHFRYYTFKKPSHPPRIQIRLAWDTS